MNAGFVMAAIFAASAQSASWWSGASAVVSSNPSSSAIQGAIANGALGCAPVPVRDGVILIVLHRPAQGHQPARFITPEGKEVARLAMGAAVQSIRVRRGTIGICDLLGPRLSPDGKRLAAFQHLVNAPGNRTSPPSFPLWVFDLESKEGPSQPLRSDLIVPSLAWSSDGTKLYVSEADLDPVDKHHSAEKKSWIYDFKTKTKTPLALPYAHLIIDVSPDGKTLLTQTCPGQEMGQETANVVVLDTLKIRQLGSRRFEPMRFSPDGKEVIGYRAAQERNPANAGVLVIASVEGGLERTIALPPGASSSLFACWSPDGKRIAYTWKEARAALDVPEGDTRPGQRKTEQPALPCARVVVADFDGTRAKTIYQGEPGQSFVGIDWR